MTSTGRDGQNHTGALMRLVKGRLVPLTWGVECPLCGGVIEIEHVGEDNSGAFYADEIDTAPDCPTCIVCVETPRVALQGVVASECGEG